MAYIYALSTIEQQTLTGMIRLERSVIACEELLASMQTAKHPSAGRAKYLLEVRLANIRQLLKDSGAGEGGNYLRQQEV